MRCWQDYLFGVRCKWFAYGLANAIATSPISLLAYPGCPRNMLLAIKTYCFDMWQVLVFVKHRGEHLASNLCYLDTFQLYANHANNLRQVTFYSSEMLSSIYVLLP